MIRHINAPEYALNRSDIRNIRYGSGIKHRKAHKRETYHSDGLYGNGIYGNGLWDDVKSGAKKVGNFAVENADKIGKVVDVVHKTAKAGLDIAKDVQDLKRTKELRKSQEDSLRSKKASQASDTHTASTKNDTDNEVFKKLRLQSQAIKKGKGLFLN